MEVEQNPGFLAALQIVEWGGRVVPGFISKEGNKVPLGGNWVRNATKDVATLRLWWQRWPGTWPGVVSSTDSVVVLDCDRPESVEWFSGLVQETGGWKSGGWVYRTPGRGGGLHVIWKWPQERLPGTFRQAKVWVGSEGGEVQLRGAGHFTLCAGARRKDGKYEILEEPGGGGFVEPPSALLNLFLAKSVVSTGSVGSSDLKEISPEEAWKNAPYMDGRKNTVAGLAWYLAIRGGTEESVSSECVRFGAECCVPPLDVETCVSKAQYAVRRAMVHRMESTAEAQKLLNLWSRYEPRNV